MHNAILSLALVAQLSSPASTPPVSSVPAVSPPPAPSTVLRAKVMGGGCIGGTTSSFDDLAGLSDGLVERRSSLRVDGGSVNAVSEAGGFLLPIDGEAEWFSAAHVDAFLSATSPLTRDVVEQDLPVLVTPSGVYFELPARGRTDWLTQMKAARERDEPGPPRTIVSGRLSRVVRGEHALWLLEVPTLAGATVTDAILDRSSEELEHHFVLRLSLPDQVTLFAIDRPIGGAGRVKGLLDATRDGAPLFHLGPFDADDDLSVGASGWCTQGLARLDVSAGVPTSDDLRAGLDKLAVFGVNAHVPLLMSDVRPADGSAAAAAIAPWLIVEDGELRVLVLGMVGATGLAALRTAERATVRVVGAQQAVDDAVVAAQGRLGRPPDAVVVLNALSPTDRSAQASIDRSELAMLRGVHVVLERRARTGAERTTEVVEDVGTGRPRAPLATFGHAGVAVGTLRIEARDGRPVLLRFDDELVTRDAPIDRPLQRAIGTSMRGKLIEATRVAFPAPDAFLRAHAELRPFVWGEHILYGGVASMNDEQDPPMLFDPLWLTLLANISRERLDADAAFIRNHPRQSRIVGPIVRVIVDGWLSRSGDVREFTLKGSELLALMKRVQPVASVEPGHLVMTSGVNVDAGRVGGRTVVPTARYRVVVSESLLEEPGFADVLRPHIGGAPTHALKQLVLARLDDAGAKAGTFTSEQAAALHHLLLPQRDDVVVSVQAGVEELSGTAVALRNSDNIAGYAVTRETRATSPNLFQGGLRLNAFTLVDGPDVAFETRLRVAYDGVLIDLPEVPVNLRLSEQRDDVVLSGELRANRIGVAIADDRITVVPFVQVAFDSELTATPDATRPDAWLPHQLIVRETVGVVATPGPLLRQVRLGVVAQHDLSDLPGGGGAHHDVGIAGGYQATVPLVGALLLQSELDVRAFVPDDDDRAVDLALRLQGVERLVLPLSETTSFFVFVDAFVFAGKTAVNAEPAWNAISGVGLQFSELWR